MASWIHVGGGSGDPVCDADRDDPDRPVIVEAKPRHDCCPPIFHASVIRQPALAADHGVSRMRAEAV